MVGGAVRDALLGRPWHDVDWATPDPEGAARNRAEREGGTAFPIDPERGAWRTVLPPRADTDRSTDGPEPTTVDFVPLDGPIERDLARRDFTIDAMAVGPEGPVDPHDGRSDLAARRLRSVSPGAFRDDPLRPLRGVRLAAELGLTWEAATRDRAREAVEALRSGTLPAPAPERIRDELIRIVRGDRPGDALDEAHALGLLAYVLPEAVEGDGVAQGGLHHLDVLRHQLEALQRLASAFPDADDALRLATLLHDVGKPACRTVDPDGRIRFHGHAEVGARIVRRRLTVLRFPRAVRDRSAELVRRHMLPLPKGDREARRFVHRRRTLLPDLLRLMLADREAARGPLASQGARDAYRTALGRVLRLLDEESAPVRAPWLDGRFVMRVLDLGPGPEVGQALRFLRESWAVGDVRDADEAEAALRRFARARDRATGDGR